MIMEAISSSAIIPALLKSTARHADSTITFWTYYASPKMD